MIYIWRVTGNACLGYTQIYRLTVHEIHVLSTLSVSQFVGHHPQLHDQLSGPHIRPGNVHFHLRVVDLANQPIARHIRQVPECAHTCRGVHVFFKAALGDFTQCGIERQR